MNKKLREKISIKMSKLEARIIELEKKEELCSNLQTWIKQLSQHAVDMIEQKHPICTYRFLIYEKMTPPVEYVDGIALGLLEFNNALILAHDAIQELQQYKGRKTK